MTLDDLWRALALVIVLEGLLYAMFPEQMRRLLALTLSQPEEALRKGGLAIACLGIAALWWLR